MTPALLSHVVFIPALRLVRLLHKGALVWRFYGVRHGVGIVMCIVCAKCKEVRLGQKGPNDTGSNHAHA